MKCLSCNVHMNQVPGTVEQVTKTIKQAKVQCPKCMKIKIECWYSKGYK